MVKRRRELAYLPVLTVVGDSGVNKGREDILVEGLVLEHYMHEAQPLKNTLQLFFYIISYKNITTIGSLKITFLIPLPI